MIKLIKKLAFRSGQSGEIIVVILLVMAVGLTIGLSVAGRSLTDVRLSTQIDESNRAFSAAEAGIENVLNQGLYGAATGATSGTVGGSSYDVTVGTLGGSTSIFTFPTAIEDGDTQTVWLVPHDANGIVETATYTQNTIDICWKKENSSDPVPALEASVLFKDVSSNTYKIMRGAFDPDTSRRSSNGFDNVSSGSTCSGNGYDYYKQINFNSLASGIGGISLSSDILIALRLRPVYTRAKIAVVPAGGAGGSLPEQGKNISSTGKTGSGVTRRWNVVQTYSAPTDLFDYAVWSNTNLEK